MMVFIGMLISVDVLLMMLSVGFDGIQNLLAVGKGEVCPRLPKRLNDEVDEADLIHRNITVLVWLSMVCHFDVADYRTCNHLDELGSVGSGDLSLVWGSYCLGTSFTHIYTELYF